MRHNSLSPHNPKPIHAKPVQKKSFAARHRSLLGWSSLMVVLGSYGAYIYHLKAPSQQNRLAEIQQQRNIGAHNLISLTHQETIEKLKTISNLTASQEKTLALRTIEQGLSGFETVTQTAPSKEAILNETLTSFETAKAVVMKEKRVGEVKPVAYKPDVAPDMIYEENELVEDHDGDEDFSGQVVNEGRAKQASKVQFAIRLITSPSLYVVEEKWYELKEADQDNILEELQPKFVVTSHSSRKKTYTLLAGPYKTAVQAVNVCKSLQSLTEKCSEDIYRGENLFQTGKGDEDFPVGAIGYDGAPKIR